MKLANATVPITVASRGIGAAFAKAALARGARKVCAGAGDPKKVALPGVTPIPLDVNSPPDRAAAVMAAGDVTLVINNAGGALLNAASVASWITRPGLAVHAVSKSAAGSLSNGLRNELRGQNSQILTLHMAFADTDMTQGIDSPKSTPDDIVARAFDALEAGADEVPTDELTQQVKPGPSAQSGVYLQARDSA